MDLRHPGLSIHHIRSACAPLLTLRATYEEVRILLSALTFLEWDWEVALLVIRTRTDKPFDEIDPYPRDEDKPLSRSQRVEEIPDDAIELLPQWLSNHLIGIDITET
jgi:hypothetical protein